MRGKDDKYGKQCNNILFLVIDDIYSIEGINRAYFCKNSGKQLKHEKIKLDFNLQPSFFFTLCLHYLIKL